MVGVRVRVQGRVKSKTIIDTFRCYSKTFGTSPLKRIFRYQGSWRFVSITTGCSLNIVFFSELFKIFWTLFSLCVSVCTHTRQKTSAAAELAEFRKITKF